MEVSSIPNLCLELISSAFQRCRLSEHLCRLSVVLKSSPSSDPPAVQVSVSDTGIGSSLDEFQELKCPRGGISAEKWDGVLCIRTTGIYDEEVHHYRLNLRDCNSGRRLIRLPSNLKNNAKFSGTEVSFSIYEDIDFLASEINCFVLKILILKIPNVAIELVAECGDIPGSRIRNVFLANESNSLPFSTSNIECLKAGLEDYVLKHGNSLSQICLSCFPTLEHLKVGHGTACSTESNRNSGLTMDVVIIMSESEASRPSFRACNSKSEVLYFKDFRPHSLPQSSLNALASVDWKSYGLNLRNVVDQDGYLLEWENLPPHVHITMRPCFPSLVVKVMIQSARHKNLPGHYLLKNAVKLALSDLKEKHTGTLLSAHALKISRYAPDLARSIAGLILSSDEPDFQGECFSLLGFQSREIAKENLEDCVKEKIISVIEMNDRKSQRSKEVATFLFDDDCLLDSNLEDMQCEEGNLQEAYTVFSSVGTSQKNLLTCHDY